MKFKILLTALFFAWTTSAQTIEQLLDSAAKFPAMPRNIGGLNPFVGNNPTFGSGTPFNDIEWTSFDTDYIEGETNGFDIFCPVDPSDAYPGSNHVKLVTCVSRLNTDESYGGAKGDRIILGTAENLKPFFLRGTDGLDNDYCVIINFDYNNGFIQLKGESNDYRLIYGTLADSCATEGWYLFYTANSNIDLVAFIFPCWDIEDPNNPPNPLYLCNTSRLLSLSNPNNFKFAQPISTIVSQPNGLVQFGTNGREIMHGLTVDNSGNIYAYGATDGNLDNGNNPDNEIFVVKFSPNGNQLWVRELGVSDGTLIFDAVTDDLYLFAAGRTLGSLPGFTNAGGWDGILLKLDLITGQIVDTDQWGNIGLDGYGNITLDDAGNLYVSGAGSPFGQPTGDSLFLVAKHSKLTLNNIWRKLDPALPNSVKLAEAWGGITYIPASVPGAGKLLVAGWFNANATTVADGFISIYSNLNQTIPTRISAKSVSSPGPKADWVLDNVVDRSGNVYAVGYTTGNLQGTHKGDGDAFIVKYDSDLNNPIYKQIGTSKTDMFRKLEIDTNGILYAVGYTYGDYSTPNYTGVNQDRTLKTGDVLIQKFDSNLNLMEARQFGTPYEDRSSTCFKNNILYIGGMTEGSLVSANTSSFDGYVVKITLDSLSIVSVNFDDVLSVSDYYLIQNYPNPFNPTTSISFTIPVAQHVRLDIFDVLGRIVVTLVDRTMTGGLHSVDFDASGLASGMYLYSLTAGDYIKTRKMTLLK